MPRLTKRPDAQWAIEMAGVACEVPSISSPRLRLDADPIGRERRGGRRLMHIGLFRPEDGLSMA
jgi:hypothetical protein